VYHEVALLRIPDEEERRLPNVEHPAPSSIHLLRCVYCVSVTQQNPWPLYGPQGKPDFEREFSGGSKGVLIGLPNCHTLACEKWLLLVRRGMIFRVHVKVTSDLRTCAAAITRRMRLVVGPLAIPVQQQYFSRKTLNAAQIVRF
jgi:hypothetical protein